jgi:oligoribonuclease (3'-5' exoribonuclease)
LGQAKAYAAYRKQFHYRYVLEKVKEMAKTRVEKILALPTWDDKQDAVDELFETVEEELKGQEEILGMHPDFGKWVGRA